MQHRALSRQVGFSVPKKWKGGVNRYLVPVLVTLGITGLEMHQQFQIRVHPIVGIFIMLPILRSPIPITLITTF